MFSTSSGDRSEAAPITESRSPLAALLLAAMVIVVASGCVGETSEREDAAEETPAAVAEGPPPVTGDTVTTASGLKYIVIEPGDGPSPQPGDQVSVHYTGWLTSGQKFDSSRDRGEPFQYQLGGRVIDGWNEGIDSLRVGAVARLIIPPELGYGAAGRPPIPPNATLIFDVELMDIQQ